MKFNIIKLFLGIVLFLSVNACTNKKESNVDKTNLLYPIEFDQKSGYIDNTGKLVIDSIFDYAGDFKDSLAIVRINGKEGVINKKGTFYLNPSYLDVRSPLDGIWAVKITENAYGLIDNSSLNKIMPIKEPVDDVWHAGGKYFKGVIFNKKNNSKVEFFLNKEGERISKNYGSIEYCDESKSYIILKGAHSFEKFYQENAQYGILDSNLNTILEPKYAEIECPQEGMSVFYDKDGYGFLDIQGKIVIPPQFHEANSFCNGLARCGFYINEQYEGKYGYIDTKGRKVIPFLFDFADDFKNGLAKVGIGNFPRFNRVSMVPFREVPNQTFGFINEKGTYIIPPVYLQMAVPSYIDDETGLVKDILISDSLIVLHKNGKFGALGMNNEVIISFDYELLSDFKDGFAKFTKDRKSGIMNKKGDVIFKSYSNLFFFEGFDENCIGKVTIEGEEGFIDCQGNYVWKPER